MYKGTINSLYDNPFKFNFNSEELPFGFIHKIKNEVYVLSDQGKRSLKIQIESEQDILYIKTTQIILIYEIGNLKIKSTLSNVIIKKKKDSDFYDLIFEQIMF